MFTAHGQYFSTLYTGGNIFSARMPHQIKGKQLCRHTGCSYHQGVADIHWLCYTVTHAMYIAITPSSSAQQRRFKQSQSLILGMWHHPGALLSNGESRVSTPQSKRAPWRELECQGHTSPLYLNITSLSGSPLNNRSNLSQSQSCCQRMVRPQQREYSQSIWLGFGTRDLLVPSIHNQDMEKTVVDELNYLFLANLSGNKAQSKGLCNKNHIGPFPSSPPHPNVRYKFNLGIWASAEDGRSVSSFVCNGEICEQLHRSLRPAQEICLILQQWQRKTHALRAFLNCSPCASICLRWNKSELVIMTGQSLDYPDMWQDKSRTGQMLAKEAFMNIKFILQFSSHRFWIHCW